MHILLFGIGVLVGMTIGVFVMGLITSNRFMVMEDTNTFLRIEIKRLNERIARGVNYVETPTGCFSGM